MTKITSETRAELRQWIAQAVEDLKFGNLVEFDVRDGDGPVDRTPNQPIAARRYMQLSTYHAERCGRHCASVNIYSNDERRFDTLHDIKGNTLR